MDNLNTLRNKDLLKHFEDIPASNIYYSKGRVLALIKFDEDITAFTKEQPVEIDTTKNDMNYTQQTGVITTFARNKRMYSVDVEILAKHICARLVYITVVHNQYSVTVDGMASFIFYLNGNLYFLFVV